MGEVWRAHDTSTNRIVAIKLLPPHLAQDDGFVKRFRREAEAAARLNSPHIIPIHDYGEIDGRLYVNMRLIEGRDLQEVLADGPMEPGRAVRIIEQVAKALHSAHKIGLVHRDVKPSNILLDEDEFAYLIDFGIARGLDETRLTGTGSIFGSWHYMSPERLRAGQVDARADIYALACVLYECLTGSTPFPGDNFEQQITAHLTEPPPRPSSTDPNVPATFDPVIATGMAKDPDQRYGTTVELANAAHNAITTPLAPLTEPALLAEPTQPATAVATPPPLPSAPTGDQRNRRRRRIALAGGAAVIATVIVALAVVFTNGTQHASPARPASTAPPNTGPFTGVYRADFSASATNGKPDPGGTPSTGQWAVRSACRSTGCVATANATGGPTLQSAFVFDDIGGGWHAVSTALVNSLPTDPAFGGCTPGEYWTVITLQPRPDGTLAGQYRATGPPNCETERTVTFTRIGDVDLTSLTDPASQPVRVASPAEAWHGRYHLTQTPADKHKPGSVDGSVQTACLRTGERCISDFHFAEESTGEHTMYLFFANGTWIYTADESVDCNAGGSNPTKTNWGFPLPQPPQDPITLLSGFGHKDITGSGTCAGSYNEDVKFERTGD